MLDNALKLDYLIAKLVQSHRLYSLDVVFIVLSLSVILAILIAVLFITKQNYKRGFRLFVASAITFFSIELVKILVGRWRPDRSEALSFPSLHTTFAFLLAFYLPVKRKYRAMLIIWAVLIAFSRMWLNLHYFSDVFAGAALGIIIANYLELQELRKKLKSKHRKRKVLKR